MSGIYIHYSSLFITQQLSSSLIPVFTSSGVDGDTVGAYCRVANSDFRVWKEPLFTEQHSEF